MKTHIQCPLLIERVYCEIITVTEHLCFREMHIYKCIDIYEHIYIYVSLD